MIDLYASQPHYLDHLAPIWRVLPPELRGDLHYRTTPARWPADRWVLVGGYADAQKAAPRPLVYVEHGAGQSYSGDLRAAADPSYSGGQGEAHRTVRLYLAPNQAAADRWRARGRLAVVVGCPKLDPWHRGVRGAPMPRTVAVTFHWPCSLCPEAGTALPHYQPALAAQVARWRANGWSVWGHGHPRATTVLRRLWARLAVPWVPDLADVLDGASVLVGDNSSALYEMASLGRPVVCLNAPWYRRDVHHGLRFWSHPPGVQVDDAEQLAQLDLAVLHHPAADAIRRAAVAAAYHRTDGLAAERAANAIIECMGADQP